MQSVLVVVILAAVEAASPSQAANATSKATKPHGIAAIQRGTLSKPRGEGRHFLHKHELGPITSIHCLQEKQRNPDHPCTELSEDEKSFSGAINMGHFPNWQDGICNSNQEFFCDPSNLFMRQERQAAQERLQLFKERMMVNCGEFSPEQDPHSEHWYEKETPIHNGRLGLEGFRPFNLAVVVADEWPSSEMDPKSMEYFGRVVMAQWGLTPIYNGVDHRNGVNQIYHWDEYSRTCPNAAVLFILPRHHEAFLISPSCKFICQSRGGPEVVAATLAGLDRGGLQEAVTMGIDEIEKVLKVTTEMQTSVQTRSKPLMENDRVWVLALRFAYVFVIGIGFFFAAAFVYFVLYAEKTSYTRRNVNDMTDSTGRRTLQEAFAGR